MRTASAAAAAAVPPRAGAGARAGHVASSVEFLLVGGGSTILLVLALLVVPTDDDTARRVAAAGIAASLLLNYPHFAHSYQLLYRRFSARIREASPRQRRRYVIAGLVVPAVMVAYFAACVAARSRTGLGYALNGMFFLVGWHYVKQAYGVLVVLSARKGVALSRVEQVLFRANALAVWMVSWLSANEAIETYVRHGVSYSTIGMPAGLVGAARALACATTLAAAVLVVRRVLRGGPVLSFNGTIGYASALYVWLLLSELHPAFLTLVPAFHALQYLAFVWRLEWNRVAADVADDGGAAPHAESGVVAFRFARFLIGGVVLGAFLFMAAPAALDRLVHYDAGTYGPALFVFLFVTFVNVHHYFIDHVIWRRENPEVGRFLVARRLPPR